MHAVRHLLAQRRLAVLICAAALLLKLLVPTGYMIDGAAGRIAVVPCSGIVSIATAAEMHGGMSDHGPSGKAGKAELPCAFAGLSAAALGTIDPVQLAALIAFVVATGVVGLPLPSSIPPTGLRPPLRGPPAYR